MAAALSTAVGAGRTGALVAVVPATVVGGGTGALVAVVPATVVGGRTEALVALVSATVVGAVSGTTVAAVPSRWEQPTATPRANIAEMTNPLNTLPLQLNILMERALHCVSRLAGEI